MTTITIRIEPDDHPDNPREWETSCVLFLGGNRGINETEVAFSDYDTTDGFEAAVLDTLPEGSKAFPVYHYTHGAVALSTSPIPNPHYGFDSGRAGVAFAPPPVTQGQVDDELTTYAAYLNGDVSYVGVEVNSESVDGCGGFYDEESIREYITEALAQVDL